MANEIANQFNSVDSFVSAGFMGPIILEELREQALPMQWSRQYDISNQNRNTVNIQSWNTAPIYGTPDDDGVAVDTAYDETELSVIANTQMGSANFDLGVGEYGIAAEVSDDAQEDTIGAIDLFSQVRDRYAFALALAWAKDFSDLFATLPNPPVGTPSAAASSDDLDTAIAFLRRQGLVTGSLVIVLNHKQGEDLEAELKATGAGHVYEAGADRFMRSQPDAGNGLDESRMIMSYRGYPVYVTGINAQVNGGDSEIGAIFCPPSAGESKSTFANVIKRAPRFETDRNIRRRSTELVLTTRMAPGVHHGMTGVPIITGA